MRTRKMVQLRQLIDEYIARLAATGPGSFEIFLKKSRSRGHFQTSTAGEFAASMSNVAGRRCGHEAAAARRECAGEAREANASPAGRAREGDVAPSRCMLRGKDAAEKLD